MSLCGDRSATSALAPRMSRCRPRPATWQRQVDTPRWLCKNSVTGVSLSGFIVRLSPYQHYFWGDFRLAQFSANPLTRLFVVSGSASPRVLGPAPATRRYLTGSSAQGAAPAWGPAESRSCLSRSLLSGVSFHTPPAAGIRGVSQSHCVLLF